MAQKPKKILHILKTEPDTLQKGLMRGLCRENTCIEFALYETDGKVPDYEALLDLVFDCDTSVSWW